jgi:hypothetical protein
MDLNRARLEHIGPSGPRHANAKQGPQTDFGPVDALAHFEVREFEKIARQSEANGAQSRSIMRSVDERVSSCDCPFGKR